MSSELKSAVSYSLMLVVILFLGFELVSGRAWSKAADVWFLGGDDLSSRVSVVEKSSALKVAMEIASKSSSSEDSIGKSSAASDISQVASAEASVEGNIDRSQVAVGITKKGSNSNSTLTSLAKVEKKNASLVREVKTQKENITSSAGFSVPASKSKPNVKIEWQAEQSNQVNTNLPAKLEQVSGKIGETQVALLESEPATSDALVEEIEVEKAITQELVKKLQQSVQVDLGHPLEKDQSKLSLGHSKAVVTEHKAKDFSVQNLRNGQTVSLSDYKGKVVLIGFWVSWCSPCKNMLPWLDELKAEIGGEKFEVIGMGLDSEEEEAKNFIRELELAGTSFDYPLVRSADGVVAEEYGIEGLPSIFLLNENHQIVDVNKWYKQKQQESIHAKIDWLLNGSQLSQNME